MHVHTQRNKNKTNADRDPPGRQSAKRCHQCWWCCLGWIPKATAASQHHGSPPGRCRHGVVRSAPAVLCCSPLHHNCEEPGQSHQAHVKSQQAHAKSQQAHVKSQQACVKSQQACVKSQQAHVKSQQACIKSQQAHVRSQHLMSNKPTKVKDL